MFWFTKKSAKGQPKRLKAALEEVEATPNKDTVKAVRSVLTRIVETFNNAEYNRENLPQIINTKLYRGCTVEKLIKFMPFFDQPTNNDISTLLQSSTRENQESSLPEYLLSNKSALETLFSYVDDPKLFSVANIIIRECIKKDSFLAYLFESKMVFSFVKFLNGSNFELITSSFKTFEQMLLANPAISAQYVEDNYDVFSLEMKTLLSSSNYLLQVLILPIITNFITKDQCRAVLMKFVQDTDNLCLVILLLGSKSKKVKNSAYCLFKLFVINPRRSQYIREILRRNRTKLVRCLRKITILEGEEDLIEERDTVIENISA